MIIRLEEKLRPLGVDVTDASDLSQPILPPVIVQSPSQWSRVRMFFSPTTRPHRSRIMNGNWMGAKPGMANRSSSVSSAKAIIVLPSSAPQQRQEAPR